MDGKERLVQNHCSACSKLNLIHYKCKIRLFKQGKYCPVCLESFHLNFKDQNIDINQKNEEYLKYQTCLLCKKKVHNGYICLKVLFLLVCLELQTKHCLLCTGDISHNFDLII